MSEDHLAPASPDDLTQAIAHALQFDGRKQFKVSGEIMAKITAAHLVECLQQAGYVVVISSLTSRPATIRASSGSIRSDRRAGGQHGSVL